MGIVRTVLISTIDLRNPKSFCKNLSLRKFKKTKIPIFPLYFWEYSLVKIKVQFWEGRWPRIKKFRKRKLLSTKFYRRKHLSQIRIWFFIFLTHPTTYITHSLYTICYWLVVSFYSRKFITFQESEYVYRLKYSNSTRSRL